MKQRTAILLLLGILMSSRVFGQPNAESSPAEGEPLPRVIATTGWTAAFARAAGVETLRVLAPYEMRHPPEYELRPSDIEVLSGAELIVFAGYETMVEKLKSSAGNAAIQLIQIDTRNDLETIRRGVTRIARHRGTLEKAEKKLQEIEAFFESWKAELKRQDLWEGPVLAHAFQNPLASELGFQVRAVFGPAPLEAAQINALSRQEGIVLIIDNWHNPVGSPLEETLPRTRRISWINFPGPLGTRSLLDVLEYNRKVLAAQGASE